MAFLLLKQNINFFIPPTNTKEMKLEEVSIVEEAELGEGL